MNTVKQNQMERRKICKKYKWFIWYVCVLSHFSYVQLFVTPWTVANQAPLSMGFPRQEYWSGLQCPPPGDLPHLGIEPRFPALQMDSLSSEPPWKPKNTGTGSLYLLQGIFPIQESNQCHLHCSWILYEPSYQKSLSTVLCMCVCTKTLLLE